MSPRANPLLIQVVPQLKPGRCGVTDHAVALAEELKGSFGIETAFVVLNSQERCDLAYPIVHCAPEQLLESCLAHSEGRPGAILVHVSGYGYAADGAPTLLANALNGVKEDGRFSIAAFFHELFATGAPWTAAFWHSRRQQKAVRRIAELCDLVVTNAGHYAQWLKNETERPLANPIRLLPVLSTVGESSDRIPISGRDPAMAVFGLPATRRKAYQDLSALPGILSALGIKEIRDFGMEADVPSEVDGIPVKRKGALGASQLAEELSLAMFGFLSFPAIVLGKSSIFAAYCAHGTIPVVAKAFEGEVDGLRDGVHLLSPKTVHATLASGLDRYSMQAWQWYSGHGIHAHAATYARWLNQPALIHDRAEVRI
jgi:hypothetical protein